MPTQYRFRLEDFQRIQRSGENDRARQTAIDRRCRRLLTSTICAFSALSRCLRTRMSARKSSRGRTSPPIAHQINRQGTFVADPHLLILACRLLDHPLGRNPSQPSLIAADDFPGCFASLATRQAGFFDELKESLPARAPEHVSANLLRQRGIDGEIRAQFDCQMGAYRPIMGCGGGKSFTDRTSIVTSYAETGGDFGGSSSPTRCADIRILRRRLGPKISGILSTTTAHFGTVSLGDKIRPHS